MNESVAESFERGLRAHRRRQARRAAGSGGWVQQYATSYSTEANRLHAFAERFNAKHSLIHKQHRSSPDCDAVILSGEDGEE